MPRILIIDGEPDLAAYIAHVLRDAGHEVRVAHDGAEALRSLREATPDLVISEMILPDIVGLSLCENLRHRASPEDPRPPILVTSTCREADVRNVAVEAGADDYLAKPFSAYQLLLRVHTLLDAALRQRPATVAS
ncbi:MAG TPA: response regulator transcription factor [Opitutaceae bacterium]|nr:response regulator transcription factor [Opitutaceae bacterium]